MNIDELRTVQTKERQKDSLQHLRDSFYEDVADYIRDLKAERNQAAEAAADPFSDPEVSRLTDEIETAEEVVEAVYERRVGKVVKLSSFAAADMPVDEDGLTAQERDLFEDLVTRIGENKARVLDILAGQGDAGKASPVTDDDGGSPDSFGGTEEAPASDVGGTGAADAPTPDAPTSDPTDDSPARSEPAFGMGSDSGAPSGDSEPNRGEDDQPQAPPDVPPDAPTESMADEVVGDGTTDGGTERATVAGAGNAASAAEPTVQESTPDVDPAMADDDDDRTTVRITADVGRVLGVDDREYDLQSEDVVDLPSDNASALLQRDAAEKLE